ncbi:ABC1 kinase family protein [Streptomyces profundus]|uniref:ABC1 kinase family protein n=1 Tax=Streptomyces profundus TaxID=2867410 RepID=UPI001D1672B1|nr:AarF/ABC1/UbiB kinase family protein [Streptomyces sp. MA3_2.13]UED84305.1 AarF/ABC1/UbiB kinase family protein [Streptomyces sp. MA3_2.13]
MSDLPRKAVTRTAKLATLPLSFAGRATWGLGKRIGGRSAERVAQELRQRTAEQLFSVLGELKGGAMKVGQALSVFESALPESLAGPYRTALTKLQEAAPPMPAASVHKTLAERLGPDWRELFLEFDERPAAAASIGQVHRAVWGDGREVAVKIQYPGAGEALLSDFTQLGRLARVVGTWAPGLEIKPLVEELRDRVAEELDYELEAASQRICAAEFRDDPDVVVPDVVLQREGVLITDWLSGIPLSEVIADGDQPQRDRAGQLLARFLFSGTSRTGLLHADAHPGNFRLVPAPDEPVERWRLGVLDFGAVSRLPEGLPPAIGQALRLSLHDSAEEVYARLRAEGFVTESRELDPEEVLRYLAPVIEPARVEAFTFSREWLRGQAARIADPRSEAHQLGRQLNLPPAYLLIHRVTMSTVGVLCQLGATVRIREEMAAGLPGFAEPTAPTAPTAPAAEAEGAEAEDAEAGTAKRPAPAKKVAKTAKKAPKKAPGKTSKKTAKTAERTRKGSASAEGGVGEGGGDARPRI